MKKILLILIFSFYCSISHGQYKKWILEDTISGKILKVKKYRSLIVYSDSLKLSGRIDYIGENYLELRIQDRFPKKVEYESVSNKRVKYNRHIREGWYHIEPLFSDSLLKFHQDSSYFGRSTDVQKIIFSQIDSIQYKKAKGWATGGLEAIGLPLLLLSTPLWNYKDGKFDWESFVIISAINIGYFTYIIVNHKRGALKTYDLLYWKTKNLK